MNLDFKIACGYSNGKSIAGLANEYDVSEAFVRESIKQHGVQLEGEDDPRLHSRDTYKGLVTRGRIKSIATAIGKAVDDDGTVPIDWINEMGDLNAVLISLENGDGVTQIAPDSEDTQPDS